MGNLNDAIVEAAKIANLDEYGIRKYPKYKTGFERFMEDFGGASTKAKQDFIEEEVGAEAYSILKQFKSTIEQKGIQARMPFVLDIK